MKAIFFFSVLLITAQSQAAALVGSVYTRIDNCRVIYSTSDPIDSSESVCAGLGGYKVTLSGGDLRYDIKLNYKGTKIATTQNYAFHDPIAAKAEWRYELNSKGQKVYTALIYRIGYQGYNELTDESTDVQQLTVTRLNGKKSCYIGAIEVVKGVNANVQARKLADDQNAPCIVED